MTTCFGTVRPGILGAGLQLVIKKMTCTLCTRCFINYYYYYQFYHFKFLCFIIIANNQPCEDVRLRGGSLINRAVHDCSRGRKNLELMY